MKSKYVLGADIGGSHITAAVLNMEDGTFLEDSFSRKKVDPNGTSEEIIATWCEAINEAHQKVGLKLGKIGIAMPGPFDYEKGISYITGTTKYEALYKLNAKELLAKALGIENDDILMKNDAACFLAGEAFIGAAKGYDKVIGVTLGTGLGSSVFENGDAYDADLWCIPFSDGIAEEYISTRWFLKRYHELTGLNISNVKELAELYDESPIVQQMFDEFAGNLAEFLHYFLQKVSAEAIVIGGNIAKAEDKFLPVLLNKLKTLGHNLPIHISLLNENAAIAGAASCWQDH